MSRSPQGAEAGGVLTLRVAPTRRAAWQEAAERAGVDLSAWIRACCERAILAEAVAAREARLAPAPEAPRVVTVTVPGHAPVTLRYDGG